VHETTVLWDWENTLESSVPKGTKKLPKSQKTKTSVVTTLRKFKFFRPAITDLLQIYCCFNRANILVLKWAYRRILPVVRSLYETGEKTEKWTTVVGMRIRCCHLEVLTQFTVRVISYTRQACDWINKAVRPCLIIWVHEGGCFTYAAGNAKFSLSQDLV